MRFAVCAAVSLLVVGFALPLAAQSDWYWQYRGAREDLRLIDVIAVTPHEAGGLFPVEPERYLRDLSLFQDWRKDPRSGDWSLFARPNASSPPVAEQRQLEAVIKQVSARSDNPFFFSPLFQDTTGARFWVAPTILLRLEDPPSRSELRRLLSQAVVDASVRDYVPGRVGFVLDHHGRDAFSVLAAANSLAAIAGVEYALPDTYPVGSGTRDGEAFSPLGNACVPLVPVPPNDDGYSLAWGLEQASDIDVDAEQAWGVCSGEDGSGMPLISVGILDDGTEQSHPDLNPDDPFPDTIPGASWAGSDGNPGGSMYSDGDHLEDDVDPATGQSCEGHGTVVAGVVAAVANNPPDGGSSGQGSLGLAPKIGLRVARGHWLRYVGGDCPRCQRVFEPASWLNGAMGWLAYNDEDAWMNQTDPGDVVSRVLNWSYTFGGSPGVGAMLDQMADDGVIVFAPTGNGGTANSVLWPANRESVVAVGAIDSTGARWTQPDPDPQDQCTGATGSNYGPEVWLVGPGDGVVTTDPVGAFGFNPSGSYVLATGTSFATPFVAGAAALVLSVAPELSSEDLMWLLCATAKQNLVSSGAEVDVPGKDDKYGCGLLDAGDAVQAASEGYIFLDRFETGGFTPGGWSSLEVE